MCQSTYKDIRQEPQLASNNTPGARKGETHLQGVGITLGVYTYWNSSMGIFSRIPVRDVFRHKVQCTGVAVLRKGGGIVHQVVLVLPV